jgi:hypothetical protein
MTKPSFQNWLTAGLILAIGIILSGGYYLRNKKDKEYVFVELHTFHSPLGWGYDILADKKVFIHQDIIPVLPVRKGFRTEQDALTIGRKVLDRINKKQLFDVTRQDLKEVGIDTLSSR